MSRAISSARRSSDAAAAVRYAPRAASGSFDHAANAPAAASTAAAASSSPDDANAPTLVDGRHGFAFSYVSPLRAPTHSPADVVPSAHASPPTVFTSVPMPSIVISTR